MNHFQESRENGVRKRKSKHHTHFNRGNRSLYHPQMPEPLLKQGKKRVPVSLQRPEEGGTRFLRDNEAARIESKVWEVQRRLAQLDTAIIRNVKDAANSLARMLENLYRTRGWPLAMCLDYIKSTGYGDGHVRGYQVKAEWREVTLLIATSRVEHLWRKL